MADDIDLSGVQWHDAPLAPKKQDNIDLSGVKWHDQLPPAPAAAPAPSALDEVAGAPRKAGAAVLGALSDIPYLAGGVVGAVGAGARAVGADRAAGGIENLSDALFRTYQSGQKAAQDFAGAPSTTVPGRIADFVAAVPAGIASLGADTMITPGARVVEQGGQLSDAYKQLGLNTVANLAGVATGGIGGSLARRVVGQGLANVALNEGARVAGNAMRGPDEQQAFDPVEAGLAFGGGAAFGALGERNPQWTRPRSIAELPPAQLGHEPDFLVDQQGRTIVNKGDRNLGQFSGGPGMDQAFPRAEAAPPEPKQLGYEPDFITDAAGRTVVNKGSRDLGERIGGPGLDEPAPVNTRVEPTRVPEQAQPLAQEIANGQKPGVTATALSKMTDEGFQRVKVDNAATALENARVEAESQGGRENSTFSRETSNGAEGSEQNNALPSPSLAETVPTEPALGSEKADVPKQSIVKTYAGDAAVDRSYNVPLLGSSGKDGTVYIDKNWNAVVDPARAKSSVEAVATANDTPEVRAAVTQALSNYDRTAPLVTHEKVEATAENGGMDYSQSHFDHAEPAEHAQLLSDLNLKPGTPEADLAIRAYEHTYDGELSAAAREKNPDMPPNLIDKPYDHPHNVEQRRLLDEVDRKEANPAEAPRNIETGKPEKESVPAEPAPSQSGLQDRVRKTLYDAPRVGNALRRMEMNGKLEITYEPSERYGGRFKDGKLQINSARMQDATALPTVLHEAFHAEQGAGKEGLRGLVGDEAIGRLNKRLDDIKAAGGKDAEFVRAAEARMENVKTTDPEERIAYFIEEAKLAQQNRTLTEKVRGVLRDLVSAVKTAIYNSRFGKFLDRAGIELNANDYIRMAESALKRQANTPEEKAPLPVRESVPPAQMQQQINNPAQAKTLGQNLKNALSKMREIGRGITRANLAEASRATGTADAAVEKWRTFYDKRPRDVLNDPMKALKDVIDFQNGRPVDPKVKPFFDTMNDLYDEQVKEIQSFGKDYLNHLIENYFPQQWKDPNKAAEWYVNFLGKRPIAGDKSFTKERVFKDYEAGIKAGFEPISHNPVDMMMTRYQSGEKLLTALRIMKEMQDRGLAMKLANDQRIPQGYARINDHTFDGYVMPKDIANDLNNYLDPGLNRFAAWRGFRWFENFLLTSRLGLSAFHAGMTTLDSLASHADLAWRYALRGDIGHALQNLGHAFAAPVTALKLLAGKGEGADLMKAFYGRMKMDANTHAILDALTQGGASGKMSAVDYNNSLHKFIRAWNQKDFKNMTYQSLPAALEATTALIAHRLVPAQKMVARVHLMKFELDRLAQQNPSLGQRGDYAGILSKMDTPALRQIAYRIVADVDDRLGQFNYDNLFWNKTLRDALHASVQSVGWNFGTLRLLLGGAADARRLVQGGEEYVGPLDKAGNITNAKMSPLTTRLAYLITLNAVVASMGAMTQYALTGKGPEEAKDFFFPKTGRKNNDDSDERLSFPSYVKDEWEFRHHPIQTAQHKLHPALSMMAELYNNKDFYGNQIYDPEAKIPEQAKEFLTYLGKGMVPYSVSGAQQNAKAGRSTGMTIAPFIGITPAPGSVTKSEFQQYVTDKHFGQQTIEGRSVRDAEKGRAFNDALQALRNGEQIDKSKFSKGQLDAMQRMIKTPKPQAYFARLPFDQQLHAFELATPQERQKYGLNATLQKGLPKYLRSLPSDQRAEITERYNKATQH